MTVWCFLLRRSRLSTDTPVMIINEMERKTFLIGRFLLCDKKAERNPRLICENFRLGSIHLNSRRECLIRQETLWHSFTSLIIARYLLIREVSQSVGDFRFHWRKRERRFEMLLIACSTFFYGHFQWSSSKFVSQKQAPTNNKKKVISSDLWNFFYS